MPFGNLQKFIFFPIFGEHLCKYLGDNLKFYFSAVKTIGSKYRRVDRKFDAIWQPAKLDTEPSFAVWISFTKIYVRPLFVDWIDFCNRPPKSTKLLRARVDDYKNLIRPQSDLARMSFDLLPFLFTKYIREKKLGRTFSMKLLLLL